jgi:hypothetical protein
MKKAIAILVVLSLAASAGTMIAAEVATSSHQVDSDWLRYDDGTKHWYCWPGKYRGVWFNVHDFNSGATGFTLEKTEVWFGHHSERPWDTSDVYIEIWNGDSSAPGTQLKQTKVVAQHGTPMVLDYTLTTEQNFWVLVNTELSAGQWPSSYSDNTKPTGSGHSYFSADLVVWEPWSTVAGDFIMAAYGEFVLALDNTTWGSLKATF